ncbi:MurR/RpiR family transcriptional regulator [Amycolatopsis rubida]|uniref:DNA-binding transcriptional regulator, MurR/RpiR family, contains HTH and SIS domains n=1 Tax=Amycolatopsis rubida TaxID=112413 RepID=A0A1I5ZFV1_9PSEU|nr:MULTISPECIES: MurR/RpiR family transcriptional regulator [Amycolatopsis]MYW92978.1 SIS domain-containing protein [Amycolatopsis rubida]NEC57965.1 MurR/RpiR family transcriptional regulator [Amycolatopsis rubida]OAP25502.1 HTH-type transcriptional regulator MurR [Amycolatopsis sp. M39]SFQ55312.1 DNA-binding transcriptional regulator, MurR/RpiR family, contains HTH and SIS domains [Amycolatopsis rubida]
MEPRNVAVWLEALRPHKGLSPALDRVLQTLITNPKIASYGEVGDIASRAQVNPSSVVRCAQALGFEGWPALQRELRAKYLASLTSEETFQTRRKGPLGPGHSAFQQDIQNLKDALESVEPAEIDAVIRRIAGSARVVVAATGTFAAPGQVLAHLGSALGYPITAETRGAVHLSAALTGFGPEDTLVVLTAWRPIGDLVRSARLARHRGARVIAVTDLRRGPFAELADHILVVPSEGVSFFQSVTAATSLMYGIVDGLANVDVDRTREQLAAAQQSWEILQTYESS